MKLTSTSDAGEHMRDVEGEAAHHRLRETNSRSVAEQAEHQRGAEEFRHAEHPHLGDRRSRTARAGSRRPRACRDRRQRRSRAPPRPAPARRHAPGHEHAGDQRDIEQQLQRRGELDQREMAAGIFQHHGLVHHGELQMRRRIVDRNARVLGDRHHDQRDQREPERNPQADLRRRHEGRDGRELGRAGDQRQREHDHQHRRLGERGDHHLAARADAAEAGADVEAGERQEEARAAEQRDDGDEVGRPAEHAARSRRSAPAPPRPRSRRRRDRG